MTPLQRLHAYAEEMDSGVLPYCPTHLDQVRPVMSDNENRKMCPIDWELHWFWHPKFYSKRNGPEKARFISPW